MRSMDIGDTEYIIYRKEKGKRGTNRMDKLWLLNEHLNEIVWGKWMILFLLGTGGWLMVRCRFLPFSHAGLIFRKTIGSLMGRKEKASGITSFQAVSTALAGTLGVGSVIGVATALAIGGPGALVWMWISACFGMMTKYAEVVLAIYFRERQNDGSYLGGPMVTLEYGCHMRILGVVFALFCLIASFGIGNITPVNTITMSLRSYIDLPPFIIGGIIAVLIGFVMLGSAKRIMKFNEIAVPLISFVYVIACVYLILLHVDRLLPALQEVFRDAFTFASAGGGIGGFMITKAIHYGISRGVFSNEAGMGSSPISHAAVKQVDPVEQGFWGIFEVFFDTIVVCTLTALVLLTSNLMGEGMNGIALTVACFEQGFGKIGGILFAFSIIAFAIPSILGWYYYAQECIRYLFHSSWVLVLYQCLFLGLLVIGAAMDLHYVWEIADTLNGLMSIPNLISLVILQGIVVKCTKEYIHKHRE